ncbi:MAG: C40 family peptidase [Actinomycetota bacterium]
MRTTGDPTRSLVKKAAVVFAVIAALSAVLSTPASAHHVRNHFKERRHIEHRARKVTGSPYRYGGSSPRGFDCSGFTRWTYRRHGATLPHSSSQQFSMGKRRGHKRIWRRARLEPGDLVFHKTTSARVGHVGIYIGKGKFISATSSEGVRVRSLYDSYWGPRWVGATRVPAVQR